MELMELRIATQVGPGVLPEIEWNNEELKQEVAQKAAEYSSTAYTDAQATEMKKDRAMLNKLVTAFEDQRKQIKKFYLEPYNKFEAQVKEVLEPARGAIRLIDRNLDEIEQKYREEKREKMLALYNQYAGDLRDLVPFERTLREEVYKRSYTDKKLEQHYIDFFGRIRCELESLDELPERFRGKATLEYMKNFNLAEALREGKRLQEMEALMEERRKRGAEKEAENQRRIQAEQAGRPAGGITAAQEVNAGKVAEAAPQAGQEGTETVTLDFRVWGTREQLMNLRQYMIDQKIRFGKVE